MAEGTDWLALQQLSKADLDANRQGRIVDAQRARVQTEITGRRNILAVSMLFGAIGGSVAIAARAADARSLLVAIPVMFAASLLAGLLLFRIMNGKFQRELAAGAVTPVEGTLDKVALVPSRGGFFCHVGGVRYQAVQATELGKVLQVGDAVRLFVLPRTRIIVGVEPR